MALIFVYITNPTRAEAKKIARHLIRKKLAACAVISKAESIYSWKGKIADETEYILIAKTESRNWAKIVREVEGMHPYDIPCIVKIPITAGKKYEKWLKDCLEKRK